MTDSAPPVEPVWKQVEYLHNLGDPEAARSMAESHLSCPDLDEDDSLHTMARLMEIARPVAENFPGAVFSKIETPVDIGWHLTNPSIHPTSLRRETYVRIVNYRTDGSNWHIHHPEKIIYTRPAFAELDSNLEVAGFRELRDDTGISTANGFYIRGFEDWRLFTFQAREFAVASIRNASPEGIGQQFLLRLGEA